MAPNRRAEAGYIWIEGEKPTHAAVTRHPWWYDRVQKDQLSGGDFISNWDPAKPGQAIYTFDSPAAGQYEFWVRANPVETTLLYRLNGSSWTPIDTANNLVDRINIAENNALDIRFLAWMKAGTVDLKKGSNTVTFSFDSKNNHHGSLDCFVFSAEPFHPNGTLKPGEAVKVTETDAGWFAFNPPTDSFTQSPIDLRSMNERQAGDGGEITVKDGEFAHSNTGEAVRFWGVNGPPADMSDPAALASTARMLAKHGVNLVRIHGGYFDENGDVDPKKVQHAIDIVEAMKAQGIYCHFSIYYYNWLHPKANTPWLMGYDGSKTPVAAIFFNPQFQAKYRTWWEALLTTPSAKTGKRLIDEPAVASVELLNEDSLLFWTFSRDTIPAQQWAFAQAGFSSWAVKKYGSADAALAAWNGSGDSQDAPALGKLGIRPIWQILKEKTKRDQDTVQFLAETETSFYGDTAKYLRDLGLKCPITYSNWITADHEALDPIEKYVYSFGDFTDRHGYVSPDPSGDSADWSIRNGQSYIDRSILRFDPGEPGKPKMLFSPVMDPHIAGKPSMLSEVAVSRPSRYRSEGPLYFAAYGSLQKSNAIEQFALDSAAWSVKPNYFMQPWTVMSPATMGQFPVAAMIYRQRLIEPPKTVATVSLPWHFVTHFDALSLLGLLGGLQEDAPIGPNVVDPMACFVGPTAIDLERGRPIDTPGNIRSGQVVKSAGNQLQLNYGDGIFTMNAPNVQGVSGNVLKAGEVTLSALSVHSTLDVAHIVAVSLDGQPLTTSRHMLLQVMSEERASGFQTTPIDNGRKKIVDIGHDPWLVKDLAGEVKFQRPDAASLTVTALDGNGYPMAGKKPQHAADVTLEPDVIYYDVRK